MLTLAAEYPIKITRTKDGDTFVCDIDLGITKEPDKDLGFGLVIQDHHVWLKKQDVRMNDYDAWESRRIRHSKAVVGGRVTDEELVKGQVAHDAVDKLFDKAHIILGTPNEHRERDVYGRLLMSFKIDGESLGSYMKKHGHDRTGN